VAKIGPEVRDAREGAWQGLKHQRRTEEGMSELEEKRKVRNVMVQG